MKYCVGVDVGGTTVKAGIFEETGKLIMKWSVPTRKENGSAELFEDIRKSITSSTCKSIILTKKIVLKISK